jgi:hypothetical protein
VKRRSKLASRGFEKAEREIERGNPEKALKRLYSEWSRPVKLDAARLAEFQRLVTVIQQGSGGETRQKAGRFLENINRHMRGEVRDHDGAQGAARASGASARSGTGAALLAGHSEAHRLVEPCVWVLATAAVLSALGGVLVFVDQVGSDGGVAVASLIVGAVAAAVWLGAALGLQLLSEAAQDARRIADLLATRGEG